VLRKVFAPPTGFSKKGLRGWRIRTSEGGSLDKDGSWNEGRKTSNALMAEDARFFVHSADSMIRREFLYDIPCDGLCMYTSPSEEGQMYKSSWTLWY
jgi:hypothetical protein